MASSHPGTSHTRATRPVAIAIGPRTLQGDLAVPANARALVVFAHGSGSSRFSPRNRYVADAFDERGLATLLIDLLTEDEETQDERFGRLRFNITMLAERLSAIVAWARRTPDLQRLTLGLFGASTGGGAALVAAAEHPHTICAVVSRGGRPDLAGSALTRVMAPTLLIVGERDETVLTQNERAIAHIRSEVRLEIVPGATHLFEEPGALEQVAKLAGDWFAMHLKAGKAG